MSDKNLQQQQQKPTADVVRTIRPAGKSVYEKEALTVLSSSTSSTSSRPAILSIDESTNLGREENAAAINPEALLKEIIANGRQKSGLPDLPGVHVPSTEFGGKVVVTAAMEGMVKATTYGGQPKMLQIDPKGTAGVKRIFPATQEDIAYYSQAGESSIPAEPLSALQISKNTEAVDRIVERYTGGSEHPGNGLAEQEHVDLNFPSLAMRRLRKYSTVTIIPDLHQLKNALDGIGPEAILNNSNIKIFLRGDDGGVLHPDNSKSNLLSPDFIGSLPKPDSLEAVKHIKAAVKKYRSSLPAAAEGEKRLLSLGQIYHQIAQAKGFKCWDALVAVATRQDEPRLLPPGGGTAHTGSAVISDDAEFQEDEEFCCPECDSFDVGKIEDDDDLGSMRCKECGYQGSPGEDFPSKPRFKPLSPIARKLYSFIKNKSMDPVHISLGELAPALYLDTQTMPDTIIRNHIRTATKELVERKFLHIKSRVESHVISFYLYRPLLNFGLISSVLETVISLAEAADQEDRQVVIDRNISKGLPTEDNNINTFLNLRDVYVQKRPKRDQLEAYITDLSDHQIKDLVALMYSGRDRSSYNELREHVGTWSHKQCIVALQKRGLPEFLKTGLELLQQQLI